MIVRIKVLLILSFFVLFTAVLSPAVSGVPTNQNTQKISSRLDRLIKELDLLEQEQEKILKHQDETIEAIKNLKILARR